jgi:hypothetical protein
VAWRSASALGLGPLGQDGLADAAHLVVADVAEAERVMVFTVGKIPRTKSGLPVPTSSSPASMSDSSAQRSASSRVMSRFHSFLSASRASLEPEPCES